MNVYRCQTCGTFYPEVAITHSRITVLGYLAGGTITVCRKCRPSAEINPAEIKMLSLCCCEKCLRNKQDKP